MENKSYFCGMLSGIKSLYTGLKTTGRELFTKKVTERYPENRKENVIPERFRGSLAMPHNENNEHKCIACGICQMQCPNGTINVVSEMVETEDGKKKKQLVRYEYDHGKCMYCMLCTRACPQNAIEFTTEYECAVYSREALVKVLNQPGSKCAEKPKAAPAPKPAAPAATSEAAATGTEAPAAAPANDKVAKLVEAAKKAVANAEAAKATAEEAAAKAAAAPEDEALKAAAEESAAKAAKLATVAENFAKKVAEAQA